MKTQKADKIFDKLAPLLGKYLEAHGWYAIVIGSKGIGLDTPPHKYILMFSFLGGKKKGKNGKVNSSRNASKASKVA